MITLTRHAEDGYVTADGRWRVRHRPESGCAPKRWWWVTDTTDPTWREVAVPTLLAARRGIAHLEDRESRRQ